MRMLYSARPPPPTRDTTSIIVVIGCRIAKTIGFTAALLFAGSTRPSIQVMTIVPAPERGRSTICPRFGSPCRRRRADPGDTARCRHLGCDRIPCGKPEDCRAPQLHLHPVGQHSGNLLVALHGRPGAWRERGRRDRRCPKCFPPLRSPSRTIRPAWGRRRNLAVRPAAADQPGHRPAPGRCPPPHHRGRPRCDHDGIRPVRSRPALCGCRLSTSAPTTSGTTAASS